MADPTSSDPGYGRAFLDWLGCAWAGRDEPAARAVREAGGDRANALAVAGHVLDFDDTYAPGLAHLSAPTAPAALAVGAVSGATFGDVLEAYAHGFEAMGALARAGHPTLYERGWHPTAVTGTVGAAIAAARVLGLSPEQTRYAKRLAILGAGGMQAAFGSDGKSLQVGIAASQGVHGALLAAAGATAGPAVEAGYELLYGGRWVEPGDERAIDLNWIKAFPCCLQTHSSIEAAEQARNLGADAGGSGVVTVHPRSRQAAPYDAASTGLQAKFSIPYTVAYTLLHGAPGIDGFESLDPEVQRLGAAIEVRLDDALDESEAVLDWTGADDPIRVRVKAARGSPQRPLGDDSFQKKLFELSGNRFDGVLGDLERPAAEILGLVEGP